MPNTTETREITSRVNAKEAETILQSKELVAKTKRLSAIAGTKNLARRDTGAECFISDAEEYAVRHG